MAIKPRALWKAAFAGLVLCLALIWSAMARAAPWPANPGRAAEAVRLFEKDPTMVLPAPRMSDMDGRPSLLYELKDGRRYEVDVQTGQVWRVGYLGTESPAGAKGRITPREAEEIARKYAVEHFPTFMQKLTKTSRFDAGNNHRITFVEVAGATGALLPNRVQILVNSRSGIVYMASIRDDYAAPEGAQENPAISQQEAVRLLARAAGMSKVSSAEHSTLHWIRQDGKQRLVWTLTLKGVFPGEIHGLRGGAVDAGSGEVISLDRFRTPDYRIVDGPAGPTHEPATGPPARLDDAGGASAAAVGVVSAAVLAVVAAAAVLLRRRRAPVAGPQTDYPV